MPDTEHPVRRALASIAIGGRETLRRPPAFACADQTHEPFRVMQTAARIGNGEELFLWGTVATFGSQFDGDRTDIHDVLSLIWGAVLRAFGIGSPWLIDEAHPVVPGEIGARHLLFRQCPWTITESNFDTARGSLNAWSAFAFHLLDEVFRWSRPQEYCPPHHAAHRTQPPRWVDHVSRFLRNPSDVTTNSRLYPLWVYFSSARRGVTVIRMPGVRVARLRSILRPFVPEVAIGEHSHAFFANGMANAVPYRLSKKSRKLLSLVGDTPRNTVVLPLDSHCLFIGDKTIVALRGECGRLAFEDERRRLLSRRSNENKVFFAESTLTWRTPMIAGDLEDMCVDLLRREPGVLRAKPVGSVNDRDGGRDILIDRRVPNPHTSKRDTGTSTPPRSDSTSRVVRVIGQVKSRSTTIGKGDVQDIRDTLEYHDAEAFLLIAYPRVSTALVDHLDKLRKTRTRTDWWERRDLDERLRRHPDIAKRYPQLVVVDPAP